MGSYGYSPNKLVFGMNPNISSNLTNHPLAMEDITHSQLALKYLKPMQDMTTEKS